MRRLAVLVLASCVHVAPEYRCQTGADCVEDGVPGMCELTGYCSFPDVQCGMPGFRYDESAGPHAGLCVVHQARFTELPVIDLKQATDTVHSKCAPSGARDRSFELITDVPQAVVIDTGGSGTNASVALSVHPGPCPAVADEVACSVHNCGPAPYDWVAAPSPPDLVLPAGPYCVVVEEADPSAPTGEVALRVFQTFHDAIIIDPALPTPNATTCGRRSEDMSPACAPPNMDPAAEAVFITCPGSFDITASVDPVDADGLDAVLTLRDLVPNGIDRCVNAATGPGAETIVAPTAMGSRPYWLVAGKGGGGVSCGGFSLTVDVTPH